MKNNRLLGLSTFLLAQFAALHATELKLAAAEMALTIDGDSKGRIFEGIGALSAGASSRLLLDYPEPQRSEILDYLFKPGHGANLHHLKVEIGGDVNSTDGSEPSHAFTREEFLNPRPEYFQRGYEWWLMKEAKKRNPAILLEGLQWGAPGWIGNGKFYSQENADFIVSFIKGAKEHHGLEMDYQGIWNEIPYDVDWIKRLRRTLDTNGLQRVGIIAADAYAPDSMWQIVDDAVRDPELMGSIYAFNAHTVHKIAFLTPKAAQESGKPLWDGEAHAYGGDWYAAANHARLNLRSYPMGKMTKIVSWSLISAYHDWLPVPRSGMMSANSPWSGHYEVQPPLWMIAHVNQFAQPGWRYLDKGCRVDDREDGLREGVTILSLRSPITNDYSVLIETMDAKEPHRVTFTLEGDLATGALSCWRSVFNRELFVRQADVVVEDGTFVLELEPNAVYSLTTTRGQSKGVPTQAIPEGKVFPLPFSADFEETALHQPGRYFSDMDGAFLISDREDGAGRCLRQAVTQQGIPWGSRRRPFSPLTLIGEPAWKNYRVEVDVQIPNGGQVVISSHAKENRPHKTVLPTLHPTHSGYGFIMDADGSWQLQAADRQLAAGKLDGLGSRWHRAGITVAEGRVAIDWEGKVLAEVADKSFSSGVVGLGTGWNQACFDRVRVISAQPVQRPLNAARGNAQP